MLASKEAILRLSPALLESRPMREHSTRYSDEFYDGPDRVPTARAIAQRDGFFRARDLRADPQVTAHFCARLGFEANRHHHRQRMELRTICRRNWHLGWLRIQSH